MAWPAMFQSHRHSTISDALDRLLAIIKFTIDGKILEATKIFSK
jgi:hypothetical protein